MKQVILLLLIILNFMFISSNSPLMMWSILEMNMFLFIYLINNNNKKSSNISINYFIIQSFASFLIFINLNIIYSIYLNNMFINLSMFIFFMSIIMKLGMFPFHSWYISMKILPFKIIFILSTIQKFIPLFMLSQMSMNWIYISLTILLSSMFSTSKMLKTSNSKKILIYSSINNTSWFMFIIMINLNLFFIYFLIYLISNFFLFKMFNKFNIKSLSSMIWNFKISPSNKIIMFILMFMNTGIPPFSSFIYKLFSIYEISSTLIQILTLWMILISIITMFIYIKFILFINMASSSFKSLSPKNMLKIHKPMYMLFFIIIMISLPMLFMIII